MILTCCCNMTVLAADDWQAETSVILRASVDGLHMFPSAKVNAPDMLPREHITRACRIPFAVDIECIESGEADNICDVVALLTQQLRDAV